MSLYRLDTRLTKLEAQPPAAAEMPFVPPMPSDAWWAEFWQLLCTEPHGTAVLEVLGLAESTVAPLLSQEAPHVRQS